MKIKIVGILLLLLAACNQKYQVTSASKVLPPVICSPFGGTQSGQYGLQAQIYPLSPEVGANVFSVTDYFKKGTPANVLLFLPSLFVPATQFESGFKTENGDFILLPDGSKLTEYFALKITGGIQLQSRSTSKKYQFALLSDDGSKLYLSVKNTQGAREQKLVVDNDGQHF
jgi:hypothetical protein